MPEWLTITLIVIGGVSGTGGLWGGTRWLAGWIERRSESRHARELDLLKRKHDYEADILTRVETMQAKFTEALEKLGQRFQTMYDGIQSRLDGERTARLSQALEHAATLANTTQRLLDASERMKPPSSPSSPIPTTGTKP